MSYSQSKIIFQKIKNAKRILLNCHRTPDPDSVSSALAFYRILYQMDKYVEVICPGEISDNLKFLPDCKKIKKVDFSKFDFSDFDLFLALDSSDWYVVADSKDLDIPGIEMIVIDHHETNSKFGKINLVDVKKPSVAEILYLLFCEWKVKIDKDTATCLLTGVIADSVGFTIPKVTSETHNIAAELIKLGAEKDKIYYHLTQSTNYKTFKLWGKIIDNMKLEKKHRFIWSAIDNRLYKRQGGVKNVRNWFATKFLQTIKGTDFGIVMVEEEKNRLYISIRSRTGKDVTVLAKKLGGGGHPLASGAIVENLAFKQAVDKVLQTAIRFVKKKNN